MIKTIVKNCQAKLMRKCAVLLLSGGAVVSVCAPSHALDVKELFKGENANSANVFRFYYSARREGKAEEAVSVLRYAADKGNSAAQWKLGRMYQTGDGVPEDPLEAFNLFKKIVDQYSDARPNTPDWQFSANALVALGKYYHDGIPGTTVKQDPNQARIMYTTAAMVFRHPEAQYELGLMQIEQGNERQALRMFSLAEKKGHVGAMAMLGNMLFQGQKINRDPVRGLYLLSEARDKAAPKDKPWISRMQEEAFATANEDVRRQAMSMLQTAEN